METEDRELFANMLGEIGVKTPRSIAALNMEETMEAARVLGFPLIIRAAYTLGGLGSGFATTTKTQSIGIQSIQLQSANTG
jgi:carbamoyl-phosphate synthase large subunit